MKRTADAPGVRLQCSETEFGRRPPSANSSEDGCRPLMIREAGAKVGTESRELSRADPGAIRDGIVSSRRIKADLSANGLGTPHDGGRSGNGWGFRQETLNGKCRVQVRARAVGPIS